MRKNRTVVNELDSVVLEMIAGDPHNAFKSFDKLEIAIPSWAAMLFVFVRKEKKVLDITFFEDAKDFFLWYSKILIRRPEDLSAVSFTRKGADWQLFLPPTLIGVNLQTRMRF